MRAYANTDYQSVRFANCQAGRNHSVLSRFFFSRNKFLACDLKLTPVDPGHHTGELGLIDLGLPGGSDGCGCGADTHLSAVLLPKHCIHAVLYQLVKSVNKYCKQKGFFKSILLISTNQIVNNRHNSDRVFTVFL